MCNRDYNKNLFKPHVVVLHHHGSKESHGHGHGKPERRQNIVEYMAGSEPGVPIKPEDLKKNPKLREEREILEKPHAHVRTFDQNPEKKASKEHLEDFFMGRTNEIGQIWRFLSVPRRMQYFLIREPHADVKRIQFIKMHSKEVWANYRLDVEIYAKKPAISKVPLIALPTKTTREVPTGNPIIFLGGNLAANMANHESCSEADTTHLSGSNNPVKAAAALEDYIRNSGKTFDSAKLVVSFGPEMFSAGLSLEDMKSATEDLFAMAKKNNMKIVMATPLNAFIRLDNEGAPKISASEKEAQKIREQYMNFTAQAYQKGEIASMVDVGKGVKKRLRGDSNDFSYVYYDSGDAVGKGQLNAEGTRIALAGIVDGLYSADGNMGDEIHRSRTNAGGELHYYGSGHDYVRPAKHGGTGKKKELAKTVELIPDHETRPSVAKLPEKSKMALWRIAYMHMCADMNLYKLDEGRVKAEVDNAERAIDEIEDPEQKKFARLEFMRQKASIYYMYAWKALKKRKFGEVLTRVDEAREKNKEFLKIQIPPMFRVRLDRLERAANSKLAVSGGTPRVHGGATVGDTEKTD